MAMESWEAVLAPLHSSCMQDAHHVGGQGGNSTSDERQIADSNASMLALYASGTACDSNLASNKLNCEGCEVTKGTAPYLLGKILQRERLATGDASSGDPSGAGRLTGEGRPAPHCSSGAYSMQIRRKHVLLQNISSERND